MLKDCDKYLNTIERKLDKLTHDETRVLAKIIAFHLGQRLEKDSELLEAKYINAMCMKDLCGKTQQAFTKGMDALMLVAGDLENDRAVAGWGKSRKDSVLFKQEENQILSRT